MSPVIERTVFIGTFIDCSSLQHLRVLEHHAVGVGEKGLICFVSNGQDALLADAKQAGWETWRTIAAPSGRIGFWFPGFIDTHIHASQFPNIGLFGKTTLLTWLEQYTYPLEASLSDLSKARAVYTRCVQRTLAHGTTTASYYATIDPQATSLLADICLAHGQRGFIGRCNMDTDLHPDWYRDDSADEAMAATQSTIDHIAAIDPQGALLSPILTPRFAPSCTESLMKALGTLASQEQLPIQTHISENRDEIALVAATFPKAPSYAAVYDTWGLLTPRTVLAHACHLRQDEIELIKIRGSSISHCPISNSALGSGVCPVRELLNAGIPIGLGTDVSGGWSPSVLAVAREAADASRYRTAFTQTPSSSAANDSSDQLKLSVEEVLYLATRGGAQCLGLVERVGQFKVGMAFDAQFVDLGSEVPASLPVSDKPADALLRGGRGNVDVWPGMTWAERLAKWLYAGDDRNTHAVWVQGRLVHGAM